MKQGRADWESIAADLPGRTAESIRSLYNMQRNYLELEEASPLALYTILKSIYTTMPVLLSGMLQKKINQLYIVSMYYASLYSHLF